MITKFTIRSRTMLFLFLLCCTLTAQSQTRVTGKITDTKGESNLLVNVILKGTAIGVMTDLEGGYTITIPETAKNPVLLFSSIGYKDQEVVVGTQTTINITMESGINQLDEVVIVGYGTQRKRDVTGAITTVDVSRMKDIPAANVSKMLVGQASGVTVKQTTGAPGQEQEVTIRGIGSLGAGSSPLYVVDGFPIGTTFGQNLNPADVESITVLKDAVSTAIYGARGSNGVILITTKSAKKGETNLTVTANYGIQNVPKSRRVKMMNGVEFAQYKNESWVDSYKQSHSGQDPAITDIPESFRYPDQTPYSTDWVDEILKDNAAYQNYNVTLSEGMGNVHSLVSIGITSQQGAVIKTKNDLYSVRLNVEGEVNKYIKVGVNVNGSYSNQRLADTDNWTQLMGSALIADPRAPVYNADGSYNNYVGGKDGVWGWGNPVQIANERMKRLEVGDVFSTAYAEISFLDNFKFKSSINGKLNYQQRKTFTPSGISGPNAAAPRNAVLTEEWKNLKNLAADQLLTYTNKFGNHNINALVGFTAQEETERRLWGEGRIFATDKTPFLGSAEQKNADSGEVSWSTIAYFGRLSYSFMDRYLLQATMRREGSSRFGYNTKYGNFPAVSAGWLISEESFMPETTWLDDLKVRVSWGITGNNDIKDYQSQAYMDKVGYIFGGSYAPGYNVNRFSNSLLQWEKSKQTDIGLDITMFKGKLTFVAEYYKRSTTNMLMGIPLPAISGFSNVQSNVGKVQNTGFEFALGYRTSINEVNVRANLNASFNRNKVIEIDGESKEIWSGSMYEGYNVSKVGRPIGMLYGFDFLGIFQNQAEIDASPIQAGADPGVFKHRDADGNGTITVDNKDLVEIGNPWPKCNLGLTLGADYKGFDISALFTAALGYQIYRRIETSTLNMDGVFNVLASAKNRWRSEANPGDGRHARSEHPLWERETSSRYLYQGSHVWVKNVSLGYTIPRTAFFKGSLRVFVSADNLFLVTNYPGNNPEINSRGGISPGIDDEAYPVPRTFSIGANITF